APADGYTLVVGVISNTAIFPLTFKDMRFDPLKDVVPVIGLTEGNLVLASPASAPWKTFNELVNYAKANPGKLNYGEASPISRILTEGILIDRGLDVLHVPYAGNNTYVQDLLAGTIQIGFLPEQQAVSFGDKTRVLAVTGRNRLPAFPDAPTFAELQYHAMWGSNHYLSVRAGTPKPIIDKLFAAAADALKTAEVKANIAKVPLEISVQPPDDAARIIAEQVTVFAEIAKKIGLKPE